MVPIINYHPCITTKITTIFFLSDEEYFNCMKISKRSNNIFEFQLGSNASTTKDVFVLCSEDNFQEDSWITQGSQ